MLITKIEAKEACDWLKAAGFPQYVQLYRDCRFPVDTDWVRRDHDFLDKEALDSLCRRISTLNKCVEMRVELGRSKRRAQEQVDEEMCCISPRWRYDTRTRHWTRLELEGDNVTPSCLDFLPADSAPDSLVGRRDPAPSSCDACSLHSTSSTDSEGHRTLRGPRQTHRGPNTSSSSFGTSADDQEVFRSSAGNNKAPSLDTSFGEEPPSPGSSVGSSGQSSEAERCFPDKPPRKKGHSLLRKMERLRLRGTSSSALPSPALQGAPSMGGMSSRGPPGAGGGTTRLVISGPVLLEESHVETDERLRRLHGRPDSQESSTPSSPHAASTSSSNASSTSPSESSSTVSTPSPVTRVRRSVKRTGSAVGTAQNDPENKGLELHRHTLVDQRPQISSNNGNRNNSNNSGHDRLLFHVPRGHKPGTFPSSLSRQTPLPLPPLHPGVGVVTSPTLPGIDSSSASSVNWRTGSFHGYRGRQGCSRSGAVRQQQAPHPDAAGDGGVGGAGGGTGAEGEADHRASIYDNVPDERPSCLFVARGDGKEPEGEERVGGLLDMEGDMFSALDSVMERISLLVSSWSQDLSDDSPSSSSSSPSSSSRASPAQRSSPHRPSSPSHIHLEVRRPEEEEEGAAPSPLRPERRPSLPSECGVSHRPGIDGLSVSQMHLLQKLSLLKLTSLMDKYSPSSKQGWNWTVPKSPRKVKGSEVKGRRVFGVPLLVSAQRTGDPLPPSILRALVYLRNHCLDQVGLFRKSGVKSRIQYLRDVVESDPDGVRFEGQSAFDVADMVKQYFRDLPEPLFSSRLCESFLHIYQYFPKDQQLAACQAAILLLPDEHCEALRTLLLFLADVVACVHENQMTPTNLAVCLAPSLFHLNMLNRDHHAQPRSSHRKYSLGRPDQRDLSETLAATQGLAHMVAQATTLFQVPEFWAGQSALVPSEESLLLGEGGHRGAEEEEEEEEMMKERRCRLERSTQLLLKEATEKNRGWEMTHTTASNHVELSSKQVDDGCPLPLWRCSVEVEAPQKEVLHRLLREPELWEAGGVRRASVVRTLARDAEVYRCLLLQGGRLGSALAPRPPLDHLLLRTWQSDPGSGPVYISSTSTQFPALPVEGIRVQVSSCLYLLEALGDKRTRLTHLDRTDTRGRSQEWYSRVRGHLLANKLLSIRDSFRPEHRETSI